MFGVGFELQIFGSCGFAFEGFVLHVLRDTDLCGEQSVGCPRAAARLRSCVLVFKFESFILSLSN
jgi:hypothetical protein